MPDTYTEVTHESWFSRLRGAFKGVIFGFLLVLLGFWLLFKNEGRAVERYKTLKEGGASVVSVDSGAIDPAYEGQLVHTSGLAETPDFLTDQDFAVTADAVHLERKVEMYQWRQSEQREQRNKLGGGTETVTTYSYSKTWSEEHIPSSSFKQPEGHHNPGPPPFASRTFTAPEVTLGAFRLSPGLISSMRGYQPLPVTSLGLLPAGLRPNARLHQGAIYLGDNPASPRVGDLRITFRYVEPDMISVVAAQRGVGLEPYRASAGGTIELLATGYAAADSMIETAQEANRMLTWLLRGAGFLLVWLGLRTIFKPLSVVADVVPAFGRLVAAGTGSVAFMIAACLSFCIIAVAWIYYRPWLAILLLAAAGAAVFAIARALKKAGRSRAEPQPPSAAPPPPPPPVPAGES